MELLQDTRVIMSYGLLVVFLEDEMQSKDGEAGIRVLGKISSTRTGSLRMREKGPACLI